ncbi:unnamed protein product [Rhodiola kirilowii]
MELGSGMCSLGTLMKLAKEKEEFGDSLNEVVNVCEQRFATRSRGMHRGFASQLCGICEEKKVHAVKRMADKRMARLAEQQLIRGWLA